MSVKLLTEHHLRFLSLKGGCRGSSESTLDKVSNCWKSHVTAQYNIGDEHWKKSKLLNLYYILSNKMFSILGL